MTDRTAALTEALPCEDPEEPCDADGRDRRPWCENCIARNVLRNAALPADWCGHAAKVYACRVKDRVRRDENDWQKGFRQGWNEAIAAAKAAIEEKP